MSAAADLASPLGPLRAGRAGVTSRLIFALALAWLALGAAMTMAFVPFPGGLDELQHVSFVRWMELRPQLLPRYDQMPALTADLKGWTGVTRLSHPAPYYLALAPLDALSHSILVLRLANAAMMLAGAAIMLATGFSVLADLRQRAIFAATLAAFPQLAVVGGSVINDNLAIIVAGLGFAGLVRWRGRPGDWLLPLALAAAGWTKLTLAIMLVAAFVILELIERRRPARAHLAIVLAAAAGAIPYLVNLARYGQVVFPDMGVYVPPAQRIHLGLAQFLLRNAADFARSWAALQPSNVLAIAGLGLILVLTALALRSGKGGPAATALALAALPAAALHLWFSWRLYQSEGLPDVMEARYYYGVWPGGALVLTRWWGASPGLIRTALTTAAGACLVAASAPFCFALAMLAGERLH
jgi:hypothetical protein